MAAPLRVGGYLYVDAVDPDDNVVHLLPTPNRTRNEVKPGGRVTIGTTPEKAGPKDDVFETAPPLGTQLLIAALILCQPHATLTHGEGRSPRACLSPRHRPSSMSARAGVMGSNIRPVQTPVDKFAANRRRGLVGKESAGMGRCRFEPLGIPNHAALRSAD